MHAGPAKVPPAERVGQCLAHPPRGPRLAHSSAASTAYNSLFAVCLSAADRLHPASEPASQSAARCSLAMTGGQSVRASVCRSQALKLARCQPTGSQAHERADGQQLCFRAANAADRANSKTSLSCSQQQRQLRGTSWLVRVLVRKRAERAAKQWLSGFRANSRGFACAKSTVDHHQADWTCSTALHCTALDHQRFVQPPRRDGALIVARWLPCRLKPAELSRAEPTVCSGGANTTSGLCERAGARARNLRAKLASRDSRACKPEISSLARPSWSSCSASSFVWPASSVGRLQLLLAIRAKTIRKLAPPAKAHKV